MHSGIYRDIPRYTVKKRYPGVEQVRYTDRNGVSRLSRTYFIRYRWRRKQHREKTGLTDPKAAYELLCQRKEEMRHGRLIGPTAERVKIDQLEQLVLDDYENQGRTTSAAVKLRFRYWTAWFGDSRMMDVTLADLNAAVRARRKGGDPFFYPRRGVMIPAKAAAPGTIFVWLATLQRGFSLAIKSRLLPEAPEFPVVTPGPARKVFIERPTLIALLEHTPPHLRPVVEVGLLTGWRVEAILSREWRHVDLASATLTLDGEWAKNGEPIVLPLEGPLFDLFAAQHALARAVELRTGRLIPWCFFYGQDTQHTRAGARIKDFRNRWKVSCAAAGMPHLHFHDLRRGAIRTLRKAGNSEHEIMEWVGLKTRAVFDRYDVVDDERMKDTARRQAEFYESQKEPAPVSLIKRRT